MKPLIQLIYNSAATCAFTDQDLENLLRSARANNSRLCVTGMLLYIDGCFFQVLEGTEDVVDSLAEKIKRDPRHNKMTVIIREPVAQRSFSEWSMGFACVSASDAERMEGLNDFFVEGEVLTQLDGGRTKKLLKAFSEGRWRIPLASPKIRQPLTVRCISARQSRSPELAVATPANYTFAFQPIVDANLRCVASYEALVRGRGNESARSVLEPLSGLALWEFDLEARKQALALAARLDLQCMINLNLLPESLNALGKSVLFNTIETAIAHGLRPEQIVLEVSESEPIRDFKSFVDLANECRSLGVKFAIDDFGAGHSGLNLLADFLPDSLKLDMKLVRDIESKGPRQAIVRGVLTTCADLGIDVVAEGIETLDEYHWLVDEGIELFQGYLFAKPSFEAFPAVYYPDRESLPPLSPLVPTDIMPEKTPRHSAKDIASHKC